MIKQFILALFLVAIAFAGTAILGKEIHAQALGSAEKHKDHKDHKDAEDTTINKDDILKIKDTDIILGNVDAPVTMFEFASLSCSACARFNLEILPEIEEKYIKTGKLRLVVREFPLNAPALKGAQLTRCVDKKQFHKFIKVLFTMQSKWAFTSDYLSDLEKIARVGGVTEEDFVSCMANKEIESLILANRKEAETALRVKSTPTLYLKSEVIDADYVRISSSSGVEALSKAIDSLMGEELTKEDDDDSENSNE